MHTPRLPWKFWAASVALATGITLLLTTLGAHPAIVPCRHPRAGGRGNAAGVERAPRTSLEDHSRPRRQRGRARGRRRPGLRTARLSGRHDHRRADDRRSQRVRAVAWPAVPVRQGPPRHLGERRTQPGALSIHGVPQLVQLRAERLRRRRPHHEHRDLGLLRSGTLRHLHHARRGRRVAHQECPDRSTQLAVPGRAAWNQRRGFGDHRSERRQRRHRLRRHRRSQRLRLGLRGGCRDVQVH